MNVLATQFSLPHRALEIYLAGCCSPHCEGCHSPHSWDFSAGTPYDPARFHLLLQAKLEDAGILVQHIWVLGGEPLDLPEEEFEAFSRNLLRHRKPLWLFTRYEFDQIPDWIGQVYSRVKTGRYDKNLPPIEIDGLTLASSNQMLWTR